MDNADKHKPESEDEINEKVSGKFFNFFFFFFYYNVKLLNIFIDDENDDNDFFCYTVPDTDDPIDMINTSDVIDPFEIETEDEINIETEDTTIPDFIDLFSNLTFFISDYDENKIKDIKRLIIGFKGYDFMINHSVYYTYLSIFSFKWSIYSFRKITTDISSATYVISTCGNKDRNDNDDVSDLIHPQSIITIHKLEILPVEYFVVSLGGLTSLAI